MAKESKQSYKGNGAGGGAVYGLGFIGALVYFIQQSDTFWQFLLGILEAFIWPALVIYHLLKFLHI